VKTFTQNEPLTDAEFDRLGQFLKSCKGGEAMNLEELDGFFSALIAGPEVVMPSEYLPEALGGEMSETCEFGRLDEANEILGLMMRHWNTIAATLSKGEPYVPFLLEGEAGAVNGNDWARGFMRGMGLRHEGWASLRMKWRPQFGTARLLNRATGWRRKRCDFGILKWAKPTCQKHKRTPESKTHRCVGLLQ